MANVLSLAVKISGDASGLQKSLTPAERAFATLEKQVAKTTSVFDPLAQKSEAAARAQESFNERFTALNQQLQEGLNPAEFTRQFEQLQQELRDSASGFEAAGRIIEANRSPLERYDREVEELRGHLAAGRIEQETFDRAVVKAGRSLSDAERAARGLDTAIEAAADNTLQFNELSGIFAVLPGPIGNVSGRISGLTSAGQGLSRVFSGGLSAGIGNVANSFAALANPATLAAAGIAGIGAASAAVVSGLVALEDRVERLSNQAFQLGVSFEFVQTLEESAIRSGTSVDVLRSATTRLQQQLVEAANGSETAQRAIAGLGLAAEDLANASPDEQFRLIADAITSIEDPAERTAAATRLFGEAGVQLLPFFRNLGGAANDMERLNAQLSSVDRTRIEELGASFDGVNVAIRGLGQELITPFIGITRSISDSLSPAIATFGRNIGALLDIFSPITSLIGVVVSQFLSLGSTLGNIIGTVLEPFAAAGRLVSGVFDDIAFATTQLFQPINDVVLSFREFFQFEGVFSGIAEAVGSVGQAFQDTFGRVADIVSRVATIVTTAFGQLAGVIQRFVGGTVERVTAVVTRFAEFTGLADVVRGFASAVTSAFSGLWEGIKAIVGQVGGFIERVLDFAENWLGISREIEQPVQATIEVNAPQAVQLTEDLAKAQQSVAEFGNAGVEAFLEYQASLEDIAELVAEGEYDGEAQQRAISQATAEFERQREVLREQAQEQERLAEAERRRAEEAERAAQRQIDADQRVVDGLLDQIRVEEEFGGDSGRARAADNVLAIEREIARVEEEQRKAREAGDQGAANAAASRLAQLDQVAARERDIASGAAAEREAQEKALADAVREQERLLEQRRREEERIQDQIAQAQERYAERATEIEAARVDALSSALSGPVEVGDLRSAEGAATFLNLASGAEDPAIAEYRKQLKELQGLRRDLQALETQKAEILAGTG